jgi:DNA polymerase (family 10)
LAIDARASTGSASSGIIKQLHETGRSAKLDAMREEVPDGVLEMLRIPGLPVKRIHKLHKELGIDSVAALEEAARTGQLAATKGFGKAFQEKVLQRLEMSRRAQGRHLHRAAQALDFAIAELARTHRKLRNITPSGDFRRGRCLLPARLVQGCDRAARRPPTNPRYLLPT